MRTKQSFANTLDGLGIGISGACIVHCLFLPVLVSLMPILESWVDQEWMHQIMVICALPVTVLALRNIIERRFFISSIMMAGLALLLGAAFLPALHDYETPLTVSGALILAGGHLMRWHTSKS